MTGKIQKGEKGLITVPKGKIGSNEYDCSHCKDRGVTHNIVTQFDGYTDKYSCWGEGIPFTIKICSSCKRWNGGWVSADIVGGGW